MGKTIELSDVANRNPWQRCSDFGDVVKRMWAYLSIKDYLEKYSKTGQASYRKQALQLSLQVRYQIL